MIKISKIITFLMLIIFVVTQTGIVFAVDKKQILPVGNEVSEQEYPDSEKIGVNCSNVTCSLHLNISCNFVLLIIIIPLYLLYLYSLGY